MNSFVLDLLTTFNNQITSWRGGQGEGVQNGPLEEGGGADKSKYKHKN